MELHNLNSKIDKLNSSRDNCAPLSTESLAVMHQFPMDVLEEIFVRLLDIPKDRLSASTLKIASQTCRSWHSICNSNTFWFKATLRYFPEFIASAKHDPHISFVQEFKKLGDMKTMEIVWLNEQHWRTETDENPRPTENLKDDAPPNIVPVKSTSVLSRTYARLDSVCWFDVTANTTVNYPCKAKLLMCLKLHKFYLGPLQLNILASVKDPAADQHSWKTLSSCEWDVVDQHECPNNEWVYMDLGTVDVDGLDHGENTITLRGQIFAATPHWKNGIYINHLRCIQLPNISNQIRQTEEICGTCIRSESNETFRKGTKQMKIFSIMICSAIQCIDWSTITAEELSALPASVFVNITIEELGSIPTQACSGFYASQTADFNVSAAPGLRADCLSQFNPASNGGCAGLQGPFIGNMLPSAFQGWTARCTGSLLPQAFSQVTSEQWASINSSACSGFSSRTATNFNPTSGGGMKASCLSQFAEYASCTGLQANFVASINPAAFAGWTAACIKELPSESFSQVSSEQWAAINASACNGFTKELAQNFSSPSGAGVTAACVSNFFFDACRGMQAGFVAAMKPAAFSGWTPKCTAWLAYQAFSEVKSEQWAAINPLACNGFYYQTVVNFNATSGSGMTAACLSNMSPEQGWGGCFGLQAGFIKSFKPDIFAAWTYECVQSLQEYAFAQVTSEQWAAINISACSGFTSETAQHFNPTSASGVPAACVAQFQASYWGACINLDANFVHYLTPVAFSNFTADCIEETPNMTFSHITPAQLSAISGKPCKGFRGAHVRSFPIEVAPALQAKCLARFTSYEADSACKNLDPQFVSQMAPETFAGFEAVCIQNAIDTVFAHINATQMRQITPQASVSLKRLQVTNIPDVAWTGATVAQLLNFNFFGFSGLRVSSLKIVVDMYTLDLVSNLTTSQTQNYPLPWAAEFKALIPTQVPYMTKWSELKQEGLSTVQWLQIALLKKGDDGPVFTSATIKSLWSSTFKGVRIDQVPLIAANDFSLFSERYTEFFPNDTFSAVSANQLMEISPDGFAALTPFAFSAINPSIIVAISKSQIAVMTLDQIQSLNCVRLQSFTKDQLQLFNSTQYAAYSAVYNRECNGVAPISAPTAAPISAPIASPGVAAPIASPSSRPISSPSTAPGSSPGAAPIAAPGSRPVSAPIASPSSNQSGNSPSGSQPLLTSTQTLVIAGFVVTIIVIIAGVFFIIRRQRLMLDPTRRPLLVQQ